MQVLRRKYGKECDIWSCGVILYILLCGVPPFYGENEKQIFDMVMQGRLDFETEPWPKVSEPAKVGARGHAWVGEGGGGRVGNSIPD